MRLREVLDLLDAGESPRVTFRDSHPRAGQCGAVYNEMPPFAGWFEVLVDDGELAGAHVADLEREA